MSNEALIILASAGGAIAVGFVIEFVQTRFGNRRFNKRLKEMHNQFGGKS